MDDKKFTGKIWSQRLLTFLFTQIVLLWKDRNHHLHGNPATKLHCEIRSRLIFKLQRLYDCEDKVLSEDRVLFAIPPAVRSALPNHSIASYLKLYSPLVKTSIADASKLA